LDNIDSSDKEIVVLMKRTIPEHFSGMLDLQGTGEGRCDAYFNVNANVVTIIPLTDECRKHTHVLSYKDGSNAKNDWLFGFAEDGCSIAFLKTKHLVTGFSAPLDMGTSRFNAPIIIKSPHPNGVNLKMFDSIEFRGGIVDILINPDLALENNNEKNGINFRHGDSFTRKYDIEIDGEEFKLTSSISTEDCTIELGKIPDLRTTIHSTVRFDFKTEKPLNDIEKYYSYALSLFQFCAGRLNVGFEMRLYKNESYEGLKLANPSPILIRFKDGFDDYANDILDITNVLRLQCLDDKLPRLFKLLNEEKMQPRLSFLPKRNKNRSSVLYTDIGDICVAFEREFSFLETKSTEENKVFAKNLTNELIDIISNKSDCPEAVKKKAVNILNSQLKGFSPSLKEKIYAVYDKFDRNVTSITEIEDHDILGITKFYNKNEFKDMISKFVDIRNKASHSGIIWNEGVSIFPHLKLLIYFSVLNRAGYTPKESEASLSWLFGHEF
jgi:hypothetical protein